MTTANPDAELSAHVRDLRTYLLNSGYAHGRRAGELLGRADNGIEITVRTGYTTGSYRINVFGRTRGARQGQCYLDINRNASLDRVTEIQQALANWDGETWPPHPDFVPSSTGQGDGWPPK